jgi:hypothetical protein
VELDCGCVRDVLTRQHMEEKSADDVARRIELTDGYHFSMFNRP